MNTVEDDGKTFFPPDKRLSEDRRSLTVRARACKTIRGHLSQAEGIVKLPVGEQPGIRGDLGTVEFKLQSKFMSMVQREG